MDGTRPCPYCAEPVPERAPVCPLCKERLDGRPEAVVDPLLPKADRSRVAAKAEAIRKGDIPAAPPGPGRISAWTIVWFVPTVLFAGFAAASDDEDAVVALAVFACIFGLFLLLALLLDLTVAPPKKRGTPEEAVRAFYGNLRRRRYRRAFFCVSPLDRSGPPRSTVPVPVLAVESRPYPFDGSGSFGRYWRSQAGLDDRFVGGYHKNLAARVLEVKTIRPGLARASVELRVKGYPSMTGCLFLIIGILVVVVMMALTKEQVFVVEKLVYEKDGLWWMANGELGDAEDRALADALAS